MHTVHTRKLVAASAAGEASHYWLARLRNFDPWAWLSLFPPLSVWMQ